MTHFKFELGEPVKIDISGEVGEVIGRAEYTATAPQYFVLFKAADGRAEYTATAPQYFVLFKAADGRAVTGWWEADFLSPAQ